MADSDLIDRYLEHARVEKRLAQRTLELYSLDLRKLADNASKADVELVHVQNAHIRRWVAQMHGGGRSGRGIALILSGWRGFYTWLGKQGLIASNPVVDVRAPWGADALERMVERDHASVLLARLPMPSRTPNQSVPQQQAYLAGRGYSPRATWPMPAHFRLALAGWACPWRP